MKFSRNLFIALIALQSPIPSLTLSNTAMAHESQPQFFVYKNLEGTFIYGFKTGYALALKDGSRIDLELSTYNLQNFFEIGKSVTIGGPEMLIQGPGSRRRPYIEVESIQTLGELTSLSGTLVAMQPFGQEPFLAMDTDDGRSVILDLKINRKEDSFKVQKRATLSGRYRLVEGLTSLPRESFLVEEITYSLSGTMERIQAIGGETTGFGIRTFEGELIEIDIKTNNYAGAFHNGSPAIVVGSYQTVQGVSRGPREVLVVSQIAIP